MSRRTMLFGLSAAILLLDRLTKLWIEKSVSALDELVVIPNFFNIVHTRNRGVAFGLFNDDPAQWQQALLIGMSAAILGFLARQIWMEAGSVQSRLAFALVMGGAMGNLHDRIFLGAVTDFLEFYVGQMRWPAFNVADSAITIGALLLALDLWRPKSRAAEA